MKTAGRTAGLDQLGPIHYYRSGNSSWKTKRNSEYTELDDLKRRIRQGRGNRNRKTKITLAKHA